MIEKQKELQIELDKLSQQIADAFHSGDNKGFFRLSKEYVKKQDENQQLLQSIKGMTGFGASD